MRTLLLFAALSAAATVAAQAPTESHERAIWDAYQNFRTADTTVYEMTGAEAYGKVTAPVHAVLYLRRSYDPRTRLESRAQAELDVYSTTKAGEVLTMRLVGDGVNLFRYDLTRGEVTTTTYGFYGEKPSGTYATDVRSDMPRLLAHLRAATPGLANYLARIGTEMNPAGDSFFARFTNWTPGMVGLSFDEVPPINRAGNVVTDPITGHAFPRGGDRYVFFGYDRETPDRTVAFDLYDADDSDQNELWEVRSVDVALRSPDRFVALRIAPRVEAAPAWAFLPYVGKDAVGFRPVTVGR